MEEEGLVRKSTRTAVTEVEYDEEPPTQVKPGTPGYDEDGMLIQPPPGSPQSSIERKVVTKTKSTRNAQPRRSKAGRSIVL